MQDLAKETRKMTISNVIGNFLGHGGITYWIKHELDGVAPLGFSGYIADLMLNGFLFPAILTLIIALIVRKRVSNGAYGIEIPCAITLFNRLPGNIWHASFLIGLIGLASIVIPLSAFFAISGLQPLSPEAVSLAKGVWAGVAAGVITPIAVLYGAAQAAKPRA